MSAALPIVLEPANIDVRRFCYGLHTLLGNSSVKKYFSEILEPRSHTSTSEPLNSRKSNEASTNSARFNQLDGLRGLAAFGVVLHHSFLTLTPTVQAKIYSLCHYTPLRIFTLGRPFVIMFFVLSGFVLTASINRRNSPGGIIEYSGFVTKRVFRIYMPYLASIIFSISVFYIVQPSKIPALTTWFSNTWSDGVGLDVLLAHVFLIGTEAGSTLNNVNWSLVYELRISVIFPIMMLCLSFAGLRLGSTVLVCTALAADLLLKISGESLIPLFATSIPEAFLVTAHFILPFAIGAIMFRTLPVYTAWLSKKKPIEVFGLFSVSLIFLIIDRDYSLDVGAGLMIALALSIEQFSKMLNVASIQFFGKISFSLYLVHLPIIIGITHLLYGSISQIFIILIAISISVCFATFFHFTVEEPLTRFGQKVYLRIIAS